MSERPSWWMFRFKVRQKLPDTVEFHIDSLLAYSILAPVIEEFTTDLPLWRFHRRAANDANGHQFSFIYFVNADVSQRIVSALETQMENADYQMEDFIEEYSVDGPVGDAGDLSATSDPRWNSNLQQHWPEYIMGLSKFWLGLITTAVSQHGNPSGDFSTYFKEIDAEITQIWQKEGQHAIFHHTSALFGYQPVIITKDIIF